MIWLTKAWEWTKKNWKWLLFPIGVTLFLLGKVSQRSLPPVLAPELVGAEEERIKANEEAEEEKVEAKVEKEKKIEAVEKEHAETIKALTDEQAEKVVELKDDPEKLNSFLLDVGRDVRS